MTELERLKINTTQAESDLIRVKNAIQEAGVNIASGTPSSEYADKVGEVYEAGKNSIVGDNRTNLSYYYQFLNANRDFDVNDYVWDEETGEEYPIYPEDDKELWLNNIDYPTATNKVTNFGEFYVVMREDTLGWGIEYISAPIIKFNGTLDMSNSTDYVRSGNYTNDYTEDLGTIIFPKEEKIVVYAFQYYSGLKHIKVEGKIYGDVYFSYCSELTYDSLMSIINALDNNVSGKKIQLNKRAVDKYFTEEEWLSVINSKPNWTFVMYKY
jgi:hypothetical protein